MTKTKKALKTFFWTLITCCIIALLIIIFAHSCSGTAKNDTVYTRLNALTKKSYSIQLSVNVSGGGKSLSGSYSAVTKDGVTSVDYSYEQYSYFTEADGAYVVPENYKTVYSGSLKVKDGVIIYRSGDETVTGVNINMVTLSGITFEEGNFTDVTLADGAFSGTVISVEKFYGTAVECDKMTVSAEYTKQAITGLNITFTDGYVTSVLEYALLPS